MPQFGQLLAKGQTSLAMRTRKCTQIWLLPGLRIWDLTCLSQGLHGIFWS